MRLQNEIRHGLRARSTRGAVTRYACVLGMGIALSSCGMFSGDYPDAELQAAPAPAAGLPVLSASGPEADYPVVVGAPYFVGSTEYAPIDSMNYDEVGFVDVDYSAGAGVTGMHHTLPLPSYVEVTSLESGRTILARIERRGPMESTQLVALSQGALAQLEAKPGDPIRVRRVNPAENERALLRMGQSAPSRMDTPLSLAKVLKRKLPKEGAAPLMTRRAARPALANTTYRTPPLPPVSTKVPPVKVARADAGGIPSRTVAKALPPIGKKPVQTARANSSGSFEKAFTRKPAAKPSRRASTQTVNKGDFVVQAIALSAASKANAVAKKIGGQVTKAGKIYRVRTGPFTSRAQAQASLAKVRAAGYRDARIFTGR